MKLEKYNQNLSIVSVQEKTYIKSYDTFVAEINYSDNTALVLGHWSATTSKHINYVCEQFGLTKINSK